MGILIGINSIEGNVGVTTFSLTLAERISYLGNKRICVIDLDKGTYELSSIVERVKVTDKNIDGILGYLGVENIPKDITGIIEGNLTKFKNSQVSCIYGSRLDKQYSTRQYVDFLTIAKDLFDIVIVDYGKNIFEHEIYEMLDLHLFMLQCNYRFLEEVKRNEDTYLKARKTLLILNYFDKKLSYFKRDVENKLSHIKILGTLPCSNTLNVNINDGNINVEKCNYGISLNSIAESIMKKFGIDFEVKKKFFIGARESKTDIVAVKSYKEKLIGDILLEMGVIDESHLEKALEIQKKQKEGKL